MAKKRVGKKSMREHRLKLLKTNGRCPYRPLTERNSSIDHIIPKSKGGTNSKSNLRISCKKCNNTKSSMSERRGISEIPCEQEGYGLFVLVIFIAYRLLANNGDELINISCISKNI